MNLSEAEELALEELRPRFGTDTVILREFTIEKPYGWVFFFNTREYAETGDIMKGLMSNTPFIFTKDGRRLSLRMSCSTSEAIEELEIQHGLK